MMSAVNLWWAVLCATSAVNFAAWALSAMLLQRRRLTLEPNRYIIHRLQLLLSAGYVLGCAYRSVFPVYDIPRIVMFDSGLSSVIVGRTVATCAELCFAAQWALLLREMARTTGSVVAAKASRLIVPAIVIAETCSWYSVLTTSNLGHVFEESLWALAGAMLVIGLMTAWPHVSAARRRVLAFWCVSGLTYIAYMLLVDVPRYWQRWISDEQIGRNYLSVSEGLRDLAQRWVVSHRWEDWQGEMVWMTLYFSAAVWLSISLIHAAIPEMHAGSDAKGNRPMPIWHRVTQAVRRSQ